jgi:hypothetical protein
MHTAGWAKGQAPWRRVPVCVTRCPSPARMALESVPDIWTLRTGLCRTTVAALLR